jgi:hypothetical protein
MPSPSFVSETSRDSKSESGFMDCESETCRNSKFKSG